MTPYQNGNKPAASTMQNALMTGQQDSRGPVGIMSRGANIYNGGSMNATGNPQGPMQNPQQPPVQPTPMQFIMKQAPPQSTSILAAIAQQRLAQIFQGGKLNGSR